MQAGCCLNSAWPNCIRAVPSVNPTTVHDLQDMLEGDETPEQALREVHASTPDEDGVYQLGMPAAGQALEAPFTVP